ncbi:hypothetical protein HOD30_05420 [Candidatus Peregrinibacteria bacterium]|jgi:hypothetical protein|nr:hypothetical protein [Candidatus Peregrinibacteria bacterium]MBT4631461.1 hypothetical protein [Candidatus Peregrinibacteria bacterium]MBT5516506.1 hypothetical protein [Candidatus Peregrinibacteria bacterium]MBT5823850.1 hypothetical protein [Candidatus Peregrinibacteria bacterium]
MAKPALSIGEVFSEDPFAGLLDEDTLPTDQHALVDLYPSAETPEQEAGPTYAEQIQAALGNALKDATGFIRRKPDEAILMAASLLSVGMVGAAVAYCEIDDFMRDHQRASEPTELGVASTTRP